MLSVDPGIRLLRELERSANLDPVAAPQAHRSRFAREDRHMWSKRFISLLVSLASILVFLCFASVISGTRAQEVFNSQGNQNTGGDVFAGQGNPNCPPPVINGVTPKTWTCTTGTQGVTGNPFCPPPVIIINGVPTTPKNWSCPGTGPQGPGRAPPAPIGATACLPFGKGGYDYCANPAGTRLPAGCDCTKQRADANPLPPRLQRICRLPWRRAKQGWVLSGRRRKQDSRHSGRGGASRVASDKWRPAHGRY